MISVIKSLQYWSHSNTKSQVCIISQRDSHDAMAMCPPHHCWQVNSNQTLLKHRSIAKRDSSVLKITREFQEDPSLCSVISGFIEHYKLLPFNSMIAVIFLNILTKLFPEVLFCHPVSLCHASLIEPVKTKKKKKCILHYDLSSTDLVFSKQNIFILLNQFWNKLNTFGTQCITLPITTSTVRLSSHDTNPCRLFSSLFQFSLIKDFCSRCNHSKSNAHI